MPVTRRNVWLALWAVLCALCTALAGCPPLSYEAALMGCVERAHTREESAECRARTRCEWRGEEFPEQCAEAGTPDTGARDGGADADDASRSPTPPSSSSLPTPAPSASHAPETRLPVRVRLPLWRPLPSRPPMPRLWPRARLARFRGGTTTATTAAPVANVQPRGNATGH